VLRPAKIEAGEPVVLWTRPNQDTILLFSVGEYVGTEVVNGMRAPVVKLPNGQEAVIHYTSVWIGRVKDVEATIEKYKKDVVAIEWDLEDYLANKLPDRDIIERAKLERDSGSAAEEVPAEAKQARTVTDKLIQLGQEVKTHEKKIAMYEASIEKEKQLIVAKRAEMKTLKTKVLAELEALEAGEELQVEQVSTPAELPPMAAAPGNTFEDAAERAAMED
jgi:chromosome segregation ATPase